MHTESKRNMKGKVVALALLGALILAACGDGEEDKKTSYTCPDAGNTMTVTADGVTDTYTATALGDGNGACTPQVLAVDLGTELSLSASSVGAGLHAWAVVETSKIVLDTPIVLSLYPNRLITDPNLGDSSVCQAASASITFTAYSGIGNRTTGTITGSSFADIPAAGNTCPANFSATFDIMVTAPGG
ncbi:MAG: hypothetical protein OEZ59_05935 [Deltaproteobacteria bacterium]|nr:hypothetical protein [Deltaproteobacteria bacterium]